MELVHLEIDTSSPFPNHDFDSFDHAATEEAKLNCTDSLDDLFLHGKSFPELFSQSN